MRFLWQSNAPWAGTGYGQQTRIVLRALKAAGHDPVCFAFYGLNGGPIRYDDYEVLPASNYSDWGNDVIKAHIERSRAEAVVTLMDLFVLDDDIWSKLDPPWIAWTPLDSVGIGNNTLKRLKFCEYPIAMSHFGKEQMLAHDVEPAGVIYHAVDTEVFKPQERMEFRDMVGIPDDVFLVGLVMANKGDRKQYPLQLAAIKEWSDKNPDYNIRVYLHTEPTAAMGGWDMRELVDKIGLKGHVFSTNQYDTSVVPASPDLMAKIYSSFDVLMNCSAGEGFGIPIVEAQACGVPVLTHAVTAMPELTWNGYTVESQGGTLASHYGWQFYPSIEDMVYRLECVYRMTDNKRREYGRAMTISNCAVPVIASMWDQLLQMVDREDEKRAAEAKQVLS